MWSLRDKVLRGRAGELLIWPGCSLSLSLSLSVHSTPYTTTTIGQCPAELAHPDFLLCDMPSLRNGEHPQSGSCPEKHGVCDDAHLCTCRDGRQASFRSGLGGCAQKRCPTCLPICILLSYDAKPRPSPALDIPSAHFSTRTAPDTMLQQAASHKMTLPGPVATRWTSPSRLIGKS